MLQRLPQELYNEINKLVFTTSTPGGTVTIDHSYRPSTVLQVDRTSRAIIAAAYHSDSTFVFPSQDLARRWLKSLSNIDFKRLEKVLISRDCATLTTSSRFNDADDRIDRDIAIFCSAMVVQARCMEVHRSLQSHEELKFTVYDMGSRTSEVWVTEHTGGEGTALRKTSSVVAVSWPVRCKA